MAPVDRVDHDAIEQQLKDVIQDFYRIMVQVSTYDSMGRSSKEVLSNEIKALSTSLQNVYAAASPPNHLPSVPPELLEYVENGRNPDIYTREFVELVRRGNQLMRGKVSAFASFRDVLAEQMSAAMPELRDDVRRVLEATGGDPGIVARAANATSATATAATATTTTTTAAAATTTTSGTAASASGTNSSLPARPAPMGNVGGQ
ncbi:Mediator of RNA polymerase II transcription subunit 10 [Trichoderma ghanense]|uniref:Mediator of RNA polymerase II transcription subunit 10 n=1 Tax=Trichoderma ghanense TaxID=65468 RepID=A0ABY2GQ30_9HYPO